MLHAEVVGRSPVFHLPTSATTHTLLLVVVVVVVVVVVAWSLVECAEESEQKGIIVENPSKPDTTGTD